MVKAGFYGKNRVQRFKCQQCGKRWSMPQEKPFGADVRLAREKVQMILHCLWKAILYAERPACVTWRNARS